MTRISIKGKVFGLWKSGETALGICEAELRRYERDWVKFHSELPIGTWFQNFIFVRKSP